MEMETQVELKSQRAHATSLALETEVDLRHLASKVESGSLKTEPELVGLRMKAGPGGRQSRQICLQGVRHLTKAKPVGRGSPVEPSG